MRTILAIAFALSFSPAFAGETLFKDSGSSSVVVTQEQDAFRITKTETNYVEGDLYSNAPLIYKVIKTDTYRTGSEGSQGEIKVQAIGTKKKPFDTTLFSFTAAGHEFSVSGDFIRISEYGCCAAPTVNRLFQADTGKSIEATHDDSLINVEVPNSGLPYRYLAISEDDKAPVKKGTMTLIGSISYFSKDKVISRARIYANLPAGWGASLSDVEAIVEGRNELNANRLELWDSEKQKNASKAFTNFGVTGSIYYESKKESFTVRVIDDKISLQDSKGSADLSIDVVQY
jgi:hypothetical protein